MDDLHYHNEQGTFAVSHRKALSHHMPSSHFHGTYEIYVLLSGEREFFIKDRTLVASQGDVIIIAPHILHRTTNADKPEHERLIVNIHESRLTMADDSFEDIMQPLLQKDYVVVRSAPDDLAIVQSLAERIIEELRERKPGFALFVQTLALQLFVVCCRHMKQHNSARLKSPSLMHERISEIVQYMNRHYMQELSLPQVAEAFYVSPFYLSRSFKEATGFSFTEYVNSVRIKEAKKLLERSSMKVSHIASKVGFGSVTHFGRVFKAVTGFSPLHFRGKS